MLCYKSVVINNGSFQVSYVVQILVPVQPVSECAQTRSNKIIELHGIIILISSLWGKMIE